jgi:hypothetical protein
MIDYMLMNFYIGNRPGLPQLDRRTEASPAPASSSSPGTASSAEQRHRQLHGRDRARSTSTVRSRTRRGFRLLFADHVRRHMFRRRANSWSHGPLLGASARDRPRGRRIGSLGTSSARTSRTRATTNGWSAAAPALAVPRSGRQWSSTSSSPAGSAALAHSDFNQYGGDFLPGFSW